MLTRPAQTSIESRSTVRRGGVVMAWLRSVRRHCRLPEDGPDLLLVPLEVVYLSAAELAMETESAWHGLAWPGLKCLRKSPT